MDPRRESQLVETLHVLPTTPRIAMIEASPSPGLWFRQMVLLGAWFAAHAPSSNSQPWDPASPAHGEALARQYCSGCHLFPAPDLLDKKTWAGTVLRRMAPFLGAARLNLDSRPDGSFLTEAQIFPHAPLLPEADWIAIGQYYLRTAPETVPTPPERKPVRASTPLFRTQLIQKAGIEPGITLVRIEPSERRFFLGDARRRSLHVVSENGALESSTPLPSAPVQIVRDHDHYLVTLIGDLFPSDLRSGQIATLHPNPDPTPNTPGFEAHPLLTRLQRPVECLRVDLDSDDKPELLVAQFGNYLGRLSAFHEREGSRWIEDPLVEFPGAIHTEILDVDADHRPDLITLFGQAREGLYLLRNQGRGGFGWEPLIHFPPTYGSTGFELADFNRDGFQDVLITHGDNGDYPSPFKAYHGIRIFLNDGRFHFTEAWFRPLDGAFKAVARDFDGDGDLDIAAISFFPDYTRSPDESFVYLENQGGLEFVASSVPEATAGRWLTLDAGDLDADGDVDVVLGSFIDGPRTVPIPPSLQDRWTTNHVAALILRNTLR
ncbi:MAG: FG-GAP-like repeat-containing protein [Limisphaerales bacterium]